MKNHYPTKLKKIGNDENSIEQRFLKASTGWIKYKPLLMYIMDKESYEGKIQNIKNKLTRSAEKINMLFENSTFTHLPGILEEYDENVEEHYRDFLDTNEVWNKLKKEIVKENKTK